MTDYECLLDGIHLLAWRPSFVRGLEFVKLVLVCSNWKVEWMDSWMDGGCPGIV